ncbi:MAG: CaiB/BaiF CoA transferase family protein [Candidatus Tectimicrobiota bacterium]
MTVATQESTPGALEGVRVLDLSAPFGALVSRLLGDLGAEVIKIEPPAGDAGRQLAPFLDQGQERLSLAFVHHNVNKRSVILDLEQPADQAHWRRLVAQADVVVSTEGIDAWAARGLDLEHLSSLYPHLVWTSFSPFGLTGPLRHYLGNNIVAEAMGGLMYIQGDDAKPPCVSPCEQGVYLASLHAVTGTLMALWERRRSGRGQVVEVALHDVLANLYFLLVNYGIWNDIPYRIGARNFMPPNGYYRCEDGHVFIAALMTRQWDRLVELVKDPRLDDPALRDADFRNQHPERVVPVLQEFAARYDSWSLMYELQRAGVPGGPWSTVADVAANEHLQARDFFTAFTQPPAGQLRTAGPMFRASASPLRVRRPAPQPGEHQQEVLAEAMAPARRALATSGSRAALRLPLEGVRILDLSRAWAGPYGTRYLADFGAEVIKVETAKYPDGRQPGNPGYEEVNRNKRPISLNFQIPEGRELLKRLVAISDVVVENFSPRVMAQYGLDYETLCTVRPDLIMVGMPGYGRNGPHSRFVSFGGPLMAYTGMSLLWGHADSPPDARVKVAQPDYIVAATQALAVTAALHHRARTGQGQYIEIAQVEATIASLGLAYLDYFATGTVAQPRGNRDPNAVPQGCYQCIGYEAWCVISCTTEAQWRALATLIGGEDWANDPTLTTPAARWERHDEIDARISAWTSDQTPQQVMRELQAVGVPAGAVQTAEDLWRDPQLRARNYTVSMTHEELGPVEHPGVILRLHETPGRVRRLSGALGNDNEAVFRGLLGLSQADIARLTEAGVIA